MKNVRSYGFSTITVKDVRSELTDETLDIEVDVAFPKIDMEGNFKGQGSFNTFVLKTKGYFNMSMSKQYDYAGYGLELIPMFFVVQLGLPLHGRFKVKKKFVAVKII